MITRATPRLLLTAIASIASTASTALTACNDPGADLLIEVRPFSAPATFTCPDGQQVTVPLNYNGGTITVAPLDYSKHCLGVGDVSRNYDTFCDAPDLPGTANCGDHARNVLRGTCVEEFFAGYAASGSCTSTAERVQWESGAELRVDSGSGYISLHAPDQDEPLVTFSTTNILSEQAITYLHKN